MRHRTAVHISGFTLVELSIVLVIVGLIVGGILTGNSLIKAAQLRGVLAQFDRYEAGMTTFRLKYDNFLPGDIPPTVAARYGLFALTAPGAGGTDCGDGDGVISYDAVNCGNGEVLAFWRHMSEAGFAGGNFGMVGVGELDPATGNPVGVTLTGTDIGLIMPSMKVGDRIAYLEPHSATGLANFDGRASLYEVRPFISYANPAVATLAPGAASRHLTPNDLYYIDSKRDDGFPNVGRVRRYDGSWAATPTDGKCQAGGASGTDAAALYNTAYGDNRVGSCNMAWVFN